MSEYPDHLNPFNKEKTKLRRTLSKSFREFKGFLLHQSFRRKKTKNSVKDDFANVEIRKPQDCSTLVRNAVMSLPSASPTTPALPRSRFKERLSHTLSNITYDEKCNPFSDADDCLNPFDEPPIPHRRRKSKKRAPLPPNSCSNPDINMEYYNKLNSSSKWSLTSTETDYTIDDKSDEFSVDLNNSHSLRDGFNKFNREMDTLNKESIEIGENDNVINQNSTSDADDNDDNGREINNNETSLMNAEDSGIDVEQETSKIEENTPIVEKTEENNVEVVNERNDQVSNEDGSYQTQTRTNQFQYIDDEVIEQEITANGDTNHAAMKSRKYILDKDVLLGENTLEPY